MSGFKENAGTMTLYIKMNRYLRMMLQHGSSSYNRDSRTREGGGSGRQNEREGDGESGSASGSHGSNTHRIFINYWMYIIK